MEFMKILRSFEEFLFEALTWLIFYPRTMWRIVRSPLTMMAMSEREQKHDDDRRYDDSLSPPLLLLITVVLTHLIGVAAHIPGPGSSSVLVTTITQSPQYLALFRSAVFSLVPLVAAATLLHRRKQGLGRELLRSPFYAQCYLAAPSAAFVSLGSVMIHRPEVPNWLGAVILVLGAGWFLVTQARWFRQQLALGWLRAGATAVSCLAQALIYLLAAGFLLVLI